MKNDSSAPKATLSVQADKNVISHEAASTRVVEICITPPDKQSENQRQPLNISLVLDRSGSMQGEKLHYVKQAAAHVINLLDEKDRASVVVYDDQVKTVVAPGNLTEGFKKEALTSIQGIRSGNSTFLSGGWLKGCELVASGDNGNLINRTLLLTDGLANVGASDPSELSLHARELFQRGITTSCFGVGLGYNEHLLEAMANSGGGNFHFLETINAISTVFEREFEEMVTISLRDVVVSVKVPENSEIEVPGEWHTEKKNGRTDITLGNLYSGKEKNLYLKVKFDKVKPDANTALQITIRGKGEDDYLHELSLNLSFKPVTSGEEEAAKVNEPLMQRFAEVDMADQMSKALKRERAGDRAGAAQTIHDSLNRNRPHLSQITQDKYQVMADEASVGMDEIMRKRYHREKYERIQGRDIYRDYKMQLVNGHLVFQVEEQNVLIDTGMPISIGKSAKFYFLNNLYPLSDSFMGVSLDYIGNQVGCPVDVMLGMDILKQYFLTIRLPRNEVHFSQRPIIHTAITVPMTAFMGTPSIMIQADGLKRQMVVDTGAKLSYIDKDIAERNTAVGKELDFYPGLGEFETQVYEIPFLLNGERFTLRCGVLPDLLATTLNVTGNQGIIGTELYQKFLVCMGFPENTLYLESIR